MGSVALSVVIFTVMVMSASAVVVVSLSAIIVMMAVFASATALIILFLIATIIALWVKPIVALNIMPCLAGHNTYPAFGIFSALFAEVYIPCKFALVIILAIITMTHIYKTPPFNAASSLLRNTELPIALSSKAIPFVTYNTVLTVLSYTLTPSV